MALRELVNRIIADIAGEEPSLEGLEVESIAPAEGGFIFKFNQWRGLQDLKILLGGDVFPNWKFAQDSSTLFFSGTIEQLRTALHYSVPFCTNPPPSNEIAEALGSLAQQTGEVAPYADGTEIVRILVEHDGDVLEYLGVAGNVRKQIGNIHIKDSVRSFSHDYGTFEVIVKDREIAEQMMKTMRQSDVHDMQLRYISGRKQHVIIVGGTEANQKKAIHCCATEFLDIIDPRAFNYVNGAYSLKTAEQVEQEKSRLLDSILSRYNPVTNTSSRSTAAGSIKRIANTASSSSIILFEYNETEGMPFIVSIRGDKSEAERVMEILEAAGVNDMHIAPKEFGDFKLVIGGNKDNQRKVVEFFAGDEIFLTKENGLAVDTNARNKLINIFMALDGCFSGGPHR